ncbi:hypothetical protein KJ966_20015 [bacterium]|nr:hypothetical protein [bacterium]
MKKPILIILLTLTFGFTSVYGEYRAYLIEVYDHILQKKWEEKTGFSTDKYIVTHGGGNRVSAFVKATWMCYGDTSNYLNICPLPDPIQPKFQKGDRVKITLEKHITEGWIGVIELAYYQADVKSNVYGVRFGEKKQLYNRYFEFNLEKTTGSAGSPVETGQTEQTQPPPATPVPATQ